MKINNKHIDAPKPEPLVIPRNGQNLVLMIKPVLDYSEFNKLCPRPKVPYRQRPGKAPEPAMDTPKYQKELETWGKRRTAWMIIQALSDTEGLEWEHVDLQNPETFENVTDEIEQTFLPAEASMIVDTVFRLCGLTDDLIREATQAFLAGQEAAEAT